MESRDDTGINEMNIKQEVKEEPCIMEEAEEIIRFEEILVPAIEIKNEEVPDSSSSEMMEDHNATNQQQKLYAEINIKGDQDKWPEQNEAILGFEPHTLNTNFPNKIKNATSRTNDRDETFILPDSSRLHIESTCRRSTDNIAVLKQKDSLTLKKSTAGYHRAVKTNVHGNVFRKLDMPRKKVDEQKKRKLWCQTQMAKAIEAVREKKMGYLKASKEFQVPRASLFRLVNSKEQDATVAASTSLGRKPVFPKELEDELQKYLVDMEAMFYGLTKRDVCSLAYQLALRNNLAHPFKDEIAGKDWFYAFMKRNPHLSVRRPTGTNFARARGFNKDEVDKFFDLINITLKKHNYPPNRIYNIDETGLSMVQSKVHHIIGLK